MTRLRTMGDVMSWGDFAIGAHVELRYHKGSMRRWVQRHLQRGTVERRPSRRGGGPINYLVRLERGGCVVVPRGNLRAYVPSPQLDLFPR